MIPEVITHYEVLEKIGEGGMGVVYKARDTHLERFVAIKILPPERIADPERKRRFVQEARAASALNHPNIITVHDIACDAGLDFMVMELVAGKPLDSIATTALKKSAASISQFLRVCFETVTWLGITRTPFSSYCYWSSWLPAQLPGL
jgi:serine/threonine protein kinase